MFRVLRYRRRRRRRRRRHRGIVKIMKWHVSKRSTERPSKVRAERPACRTGWQPIPVHLICPYCKRLNNAVTRQISSPLWGGRQPEIALNRDNAFRKKHVNVRKIYVRGYRIHVLRVCCFLRWILAKCISARDAYDRTISIKENINPRYTKCFAMP